MKYFYLFQTYLNKKHIGHPLIIAVRLSAVNALTRLVDPIGIADAALLAVVHVTAKATGEKGVIVLL